MLGSYDYGYSPKMTGGVNDLLLNFRFAFFGGANDGGIGGGGGSGGGSASASAQATATAAAQQSTTGHGETSGTAGNDVIEEGGNQTKDGGSPTQDKLPDGVLNVKDVEEATKYGVPKPSVYFVNTSSEVAYVLGEDAEYPTKVEPGQLYQYPIEGAATATSGVYKIKDFGSLYADKNGVIKANGIISSIWKAVSSDVGPKDANWIQQREAAGDMKWVRLYNSVR